MSENHGAQSTILENSESADSTLYNVKKYLEQSIDPKVTRIEAEQGAMKASLNTLIRAVEDALVVSVCGAMVDGVGVCPRCARRRR